MKFLLWALVAVVIVMWVMRSKKPSGNVAAPDSAKTGASGETAEPMFQCAHCGMHFPSSEAVVSPSGAVFCSEEHRLRHVGS